MSSNREELELNVAFAQMTYPKTKIIPMLLKTAVNDNDLLSLQYMLSQETIEALRKPTFDVWLWEPNEVMVWCVSKILTLTVTVILWAYYRTFENECP